MSAAAATTNQLLLLLVLLERAEPVRGRTNLQPLCCHHHTTSAAHHRHQSILSNDSHRDYDITHRVLRGRGPSLWLQSLHWGQLCVQEEGAAKPLGASWRWGLWLPEGAHVVGGATADGQRGSCQLYGLRFCPGITGHAPRCPQRYSGVSNSCLLSCILESNSNFSLSS